MASDYKEIGRQAADPRFSEGISIMDETADDLHKIGLLPDRFHSTARELSERALEQAQAEYRNGLLTPASMTDIFRKVWEARREFTPMQFDVTECPYSQEELEDFEKIGRRISFLPEILKGPSNYPLLAKIFPKLRTGALERFADSLKDEVSSSGWFTYIEPSPTAPEITDPRLLELNERTKQRKTLSHFIVAGYDNKLFTDSFFAETAICPIPGTVDWKGQPIYAGFERDGSLVVKSHAEVYPARVKVPPSLV